MNFFGIFACVVFLGNVFATAEQVQDDCQEADGWVEFEGKCYYITQKVDQSEFSWYEARRWCMENGGDLISVHSYEESELVYTMAEEVGLNGDVWLGLSQLEDGENYEWSDGSTSDFESWVDEHPVLDGLHKCAFQGLPLIPREFAQEEGINAIKGLLERPQDADGVNTFYFGYTGISGDDPMACEEKCEAQPRCRAYTYFYNNYPGPPHSPDPTWYGECVGRTNFQDVWEGEDRTASGYEVLGLSMYYALNETRSWYSGNCGLKKSFACKKENGSNEPIAPTPTPVVPGYCPEGYFDVGNKCFLIVKGDDWQFENAKEKCKEDDAELAFINSLEENTEITARIQQHYFGFWLGMEKVDGQWVWRDNSDTTYSNWASNAGSSTCVEIWTKPFGTWHTTPCSDFRGYICQKHKDPNNVITTPPSTTPNTCPEGWTPYWYGCYKRQEEELMWQEARDGCVAKGAELVSIHSGSENAAFALFAQDILPAWIGLKEDITGEYRWSDDWPTVFTNWGPDEPGNQGGCVSVDSQGQWADSDCATKLPSVCRMTEVPAPTTPAETEGVCVGVDWVPYGGYCYYFHPNTVGSWNNALQECLRKGGPYHEASLVSIHSAAENYFVHSHGKNVSTANLWIGLHRDDIDSPFKWSDGSVVQFELWAPGEPNGDESRPEHCVEMHRTGWDGLWNDEQCNVYVHKSFVCKAAKVPEPSPPTTPEWVDGDCPTKAWEPFGSYCYLFRPNDRVPWNDAQIECKRRGGQNAFLASIHSIVEDELIFAKINENDPSPQGRYWIGMSKRDIGYDYLWADGTEVVYTNWDVGEPNDIDGTENCVEIYRNTGRWNDNRCSDLNAFVCKIPKVPSEGVHTTDADKIESTKLPETGLSEGEIVGIVIGCLALVALVAGGILLGYTFYTKRQGPTARKMEDESYFSNQAYDNLGDALETAQPHRKPPETGGTLSFRDEDGNVIDFA